MTSFAAHIKRAPLVKASLATMMLSSAVIFQSAYAAGTPANTDIINTATVNYTVGGVGQTPVNSNASTFKVDRKVNVTVDGGNTTNTTPGATAVATRFVITNTGNGTDSFDLGAIGTINQAGDDFDVTVPANHYYLDNVLPGQGIQGTYDPGIDAEITTALALAADTPTTVFIVATIPVAIVNNQNAVVRLTATSTSTASGAGVPDDPNTVQVVIMNQSANNTDTYHVNAAAVAVVKSAAVISDPVNGVSANAKAIPAATVEYTITVTNAAGAGQSATGLIVTDAIPGTTTYVAGTITKTGGTAPAPTDANVVGNALSVTVGDLAAGSSATIRFQVLIN